MSKDTEQYLEDIDVEHIDVGRLDYIVTAGNVYDVQRDSHHGETYLVELDDIPNHYRYRWGMLND